MLSSGDQFSLCNLNHRLRYGKVCWTLFIFLLGASNGWTQLQLAKQFEDNMVLQRDRPIKVWGQAAPGSQIRVSFGNHAMDGVAAADSSWQVVLPALPTSTIPQSLQVVSGSECISRSNILLGDVWVCIGQSNMEWPLKKEMHFAQLSTSFSNPSLRFLNPMYAGKNIFGTTFTDSVVNNLNSQKFYQGEWQTCTYESARDMSAVAFYFATTVLAATNVPIGLINLSIGGAPLETFIDRDVMAASEQFSSKVNSDWLLNSSLPVWVRQRGMQNLENVKKAPADQLGVNHAYKPGFAFSAGIAPLQHLPIAGILCYQGESNAQEWDRVAEYGALSTLLVASYRQQWSHPTLPFYFVQLSSIDSIRYKSQLWPQFREEQRKMLDSISFSGMAVSSDIGALHDVHPTNKKWVGERLARWALHDHYKKSIVPSGPLPLAATYKGHNIVIRFQYAGRKLSICKGTALKGFSIDGVNPVGATVRGKRKVIIHAKGASTVYYGWKPYSDGNLINSEGLPASTFKMIVQ